jgi:hypothetical protein
MKKAAAIHPYWMMRRASGALSVDRQDASGAK